MYHDEISEEGKAGFFWLLVGFVAGFGFIRLSTRMIRAQVSWWPGNVTPGGMHLHHMLFGMIIMLISGALAVGTGPSSPWAEVVAFCFGLGGGLVLDEFALIVFLDDVYWREQGRVSLDAVLLATATLTLLLLGMHPAGADVGDQEGMARWLVFGYHVFITLPAVVISMMKGKVYLGFLGIFLLPFALVGAIAVAKPSSPWARRHYAAGSAQEARAIARYPDDRRAVRVHRHLQDMLGGVPDQP